MTETDHGKVSLDLDALDAEGAKEPFTFKLGGKIYMLADPQQIDWQRLLVIMNNPVLFLREVLPTDDADQFFAARLSAAGLNNLLAAYMEHYGLPSNPGDLTALPR